MSHNKTHNLNPKQRAVPIVRKHLSHQHKQKMNLYSWGQRHKPSVGDIKMLFPVTGLIAGFVDLASIFHC